MATLTTCGRWLMRSSMASRLGKTRSDPTGRTLDALRDVQRHGEAPKGALPTPRPTSRSSDTASREERAYSGLYSGAMARRWLSFWNEQTRSGQGRRRRAHASAADAEIYVPYGDGKLAVGDTVYCVGVDEGELLLFGRVVVGRIDVDLGERESLDVWSQRGTGTPFQDDRVVDDPTVDSLIYLHADRTEHRIPRDASGRILGNAFQGRASIRELARGFESLDRLSES
jgi:hypothetical protein